MATHSSIHAWRIPQTEEPGGLQSMELQETRVQSLGQKDPLGVGSGNPLQYSCLENCTQRGTGELQSMGLQTVRHD